VKQAWLRYCTAFAGLNSRERALVTVSAITVVAFAVYSLAIDPALRGSRSVAAQIEVQQKALQSIQSDTAKLVASNTDPDASIRERITQANQRIQSVEEALHASRQGLVRPENMPQLLESLLHRSRGLKVISFRTLPTAALIDRPRAPDGSPAGREGLPAAEDAVVFKHGFELTLEGSYSGLLSYLEQMERLPTHMFWTKAVLDSTAHPRLLLTISVFTLSLERKWL
jgi:MSHA biogenesis protein MshJ